MPVPAVRELLKDAPLETLDINNELVTPTGAAIIKTLVSGFICELRIRKNKAGFGAGTRELDIPNILTVFLAGGHTDVSVKILLETNIDDMNPEIYPYVIEKVMRLGALDAFIQPCFMKKGRIGTLLSVLCEEKKKEKIIEAIFSETSTFGIRVNKIERFELERSTKKIKTKYGAANVKIGKYRGKIMGAKAEYEYCRNLAIKRNIPLKQVYQEVNKSF